MAGVGIHGSGSRRGKGARRRVKKMGAKADVRAGQRPSGRWDCQTGEPDAAGRGRGAAKWRRGRLGAGWASGRPRVDMGQVEIAGGTLDLAREELGDGFVRATDFGNGVGDREGLHAGSCEGED